MNYIRIAPLNTAVNRIAKAAAALPVVLINRKTGEKKLFHPVLDLLMFPNNDWQKTQEDFIRDASIWKLVSGDTYIVASGGIKRPPLELYVQNSTYFTAVANDRGFPRQYLYSDGFTNTTYNRDYATSRFYSDNRLQELFTISNFNPDRGGNNLDGLSEASPLFFELNQYLHSSQYNLSVLTNGMRPSGAFVLKTPNGQPAMLSDEAFDRLRSQIDSSYQGSANAGRSMVLEGGLEWQQMSMNNKDMDFKALKEDAEKQIYKTLGVPLELIMAVGTTYDNLDKVRLEFYENRVIPFTNDILAHLGRTLLPRFNVDPREWGLFVDKERVDVLTPVRDARRKVVETSVVLTINEKRKLLGEKDIEGGNKIVDSNGRPVAGPDAATIVGAGANAEPQKPALAAEAAASETTD
jgi:HK97 family phage portal protein